MKTFVAIPDYRSITATLEFTEAAAHKAHELIAEEGNPQLKLRVYISGGGCSGFQYGVTLLCDPLSLQYLTGAQIDYAENLSGAQFVISNPNAKTTCGCGSSFTA